MKKLLLLLLLCPLTLFAEFSEVTITLKSGTIKTGLVEVPKHSRVDKILFRMNKKDKTEKIEISTIEEFTIVNEDKNEIKYITTKLAVLRTFKAEYKIEEEISWVRVVEEDYITIVIGYLKSSDGIVPTYFLLKEGDDHCNYIKPYGIQMLGEFTYINRICKMIFKDSCPQLAEQLTKQAYKEEGLLAITHLYNDLCVK